MYLCQHIHILFTNINHHSHNNHQHYSIFMDDYDCVKMAEVVYSFADQYSEIRLQLESITTNVQSKLSHCEKKNNSMSQSESIENSALELQLDIDELQELHALCTRSPIRNYLQHLITHLDKVRTNYRCCFSSNPEEKRKLSDIVAGRNPHASETTAHATHAIETVITTGPPHLRRGP
jgi:hypothetical protein